MQLTDLHIHNFMSVGDIHVNLANRGLVLIQGENHSNDSMESNGSGKSTIFSESITWSLFGETLRGLKGDEIVRRGHKDTRVSLTVLDDDGTKYEVIRHRKHSDYKNQVFLLRNGKDITAKSDKDTNKMVEDILDMDFTTFTNSVLFGQGISKMFAEATDSEQKKILERMLQIDIFKQCADKAKEHMNVLSDQKVSIQNSRSALEREIQVLDQTIKDLQEKEAQLASASKERIEELKASKAEHEKSLNEIDDQKLIDGISKVQSFIDSLNKKLESYESYRKEQTLLGNKIYTNYNLIDTLGKEAKDNKKKLDDLKSGKDVPAYCKTCGQVIPKGDTSAIEAHLVADIQDAINKIQSINLELDEQENSLDEVKHKLEECEPILHQIEDLKAIIAEDRADIGANESRRKSLRLLIKSIGEQIVQQEKAMQETYADIIEHNISEIEVANADYQAFGDDLKEVEEQYKKYEFWQTAYGNQGIKSVLLDSVTPFLNERANDYLARLTDSTISVQFNTQTKLKSGESRDKFSVDVLNEHGDDEYKGNSGGEKRRVDVAISLALQDLVSSRSNKQINLCLYDEAFDGLDSIGCEKIISLLKEKQGEKDTIFVITHNDSLRSHFDNIVSVSKVGGETTLLEG